MTERLAKLKQFLTENDYIGMQTFSTRNIFGDEMVTIYDEDDIVVDICYDWKYLEIFGLTVEEWDWLGLVHSCIII